MSVLPIILQELVSNYGHPYYGNHYSNLDINELLSALGLNPKICSKSTFHPQQCSGHHSGLKSTVLNDKDKFQARVDVQQFSPEELNVKIVDNNIIVEGKHDEKRDEHGYVSRHFVRRIVLPEEYDDKEIFSNLSSDGVLTIIVPKKNLPKSTERIVPINRTGPVRPAVDEKKEKEDEKTAVADSAEDKKE